MLRRRFEGEKKLNNDYKNLIDTPFKPSIHSISSVFAVILIIAGVLLYDGVVKLSSVTPTQLKISDEKDYPHSFIGERAQNHLKQLTSIGQKVTGSYENEVLAVDFLKREINFIIQQANKNQKIELDHQIVTGAYFLDFKPYGLVNNYQNVQNIVARIASEKNSNSSLLINCHFDSVPSSPGGSDDGINCVTMLETLRVLSKESVRPKHNIVFLFNGAEENPLQAAHGFITQHKWAKECRAVLNLESAGSGEREIVFQAGPGNDFLIQSYVQNAPHPHGQSSAEEIFQSNLIPSDTDFRVFRDFGHIPGIDLAFARNGYVYHTKYDDFNIIKPGTYQHVGDNLLAVVRSLSASEDLPQASLESNDKTVYFDYLGLYIFAYSVKTAFIINGAVVAISIIISTLSLIHIKQSSYFQLILEVFASLLVQILGWVASLLFTALVAYILDQCSLVMSWYTRPKILFGLYFCPTLIFSSVFLMFGNYLFRDNGKSFGIRTQIHCHTVNLFWTMVLALTLNPYILIRSSYVVFIPVLFNVFTFLIIYIFKLQHTRRVWLIIYMFNLIIPIIFLMYVTSLVLQLFIPITGRFGSDKNPELYIGFLSTVTCILISCYFIPLITLMRKPINVLVGLMMIFLITLGCIAFSTYGFPYGNNTETPTPQRYWISHTSREFHDASGAVVKKDSGYFFLNMDRNSPNIIKSYVPPVKDLVPLKEDCEKYIFCGIPISMSRMIAIHKESTWIPAEPPVLHEPSILNLVSKTNTSSDVTRYNFEVRGPDHITIYLSPKEGCNITNWSFIDFIPDNFYNWNNRPVYFILYGYGVMPQTPYTFWVDIQTTSPKSTALDIGFAGQYIHHEKARTEKYANFLKEFPPWAHTVGWLTSYSSWEF